MTVNQQTRSRIPAEDRASLLRRLAKVEDSAKRICRDVAEIRNDICAESGAWIDVQEMLSAHSGLSVRARRVLQRLGVETMHDINALTRQRLSADRNVGLTALSEICEWLEARGVSVP